MSGLNAKLRAVVVACALAAVPGVGWAQAPATGATAATTTAPKLDPFVYRVAMEDPEKHEFQVELSFSDIPGPSVDLQLPKWNPGQYKLTEAHRNVRGVVAEGAGGKAVPVVKVDEITWRVTHGGEPFKLRYRVYRGAYTGIGSAYLDDEFGFFNGVYVFLYAVGHKERPIELRVEAMPGAQVVTGLPRSGASGKAFRAANYDVLVDGPVHAGKRVDIIPFTVGKTKFRIAAAGIGNYNDKRLIADFTKMADEAFKIFGGGPESVPFDDYTFILHLRPNGRAGLEHLNSSVIGVDPFVFTDPEGYRKFLRLAAHELFHAWNVKRIRPTVLGPFAYEREVHTSMLWFSEGFTSYYAWVMLARAGLTDEPQTLATLAEKIKALQESPGRKQMTVEQASWETWLKPEDAGNAYVDYYTKGMLIAMALDLELRRITGGQRSVDTVMRELYARWQKQGAGIGPGELEQTFVLQGGAAGAEVSDLFRRYVHGFDEIDYNRHLGLAGYKLEVAQADVGGDIEAVIVGDAAPTIELVRPGGPAERAGLANGDTIVAIDGLKVSAAEATRQIKAMAPNTRHTFAVLRGPRLLEKQVTPVAGGTTTYKVAAASGATYEQLLLRQAWLGFAAPPPTGGASQDQLRDAALKLFKNLNEPELEDAAPTTAPPGEKKAKKKAARPKAPKPAK
ncbi:MAG: M61 family metallopeptidase [Myxococcales bacterium]|nr:M61 family metallopeptidase [Myxococcales bacterium]